LVAGIQNPELQIRPSDPKPLPEQKEIHLTDIFRAPIKLVRREERGPNDPCLAFSRLLPTENRLS
jgi:hypothetical protein